MVLNQYSFHREGIPLLKISRLTDYAIVTLTALDQGTRQGGGQTTGVSAAALAQQIHVPPATVAKVLKQLTRAGLASSLRGTAGGYRLAKPLAEIDIAAVVTAIDGPIRLTECVGHGEEATQRSSTCLAADRCAVAGRWNTVNAVVAQALQGVSLAQLAGTGVAR